jgi:hypothetical protein
MKDYQAEPGGSIAIPERRIRQMTKEEALKQCFELLNRKEMVAEWDTFRANFEEGFENGEVYVEAIGNRIVSYLRGKVITANGTKFFLIKELATLGNPIKFATDIFLKTGEFFQYAAYYRRKTNSIYYWQLYLPGNKVKLIGIFKGEPSWLNTYQQSPQWSQLSAPASARA